MHTDGTLKLIGHPGWQNGFRSQINIDPATRSAYIVDYNTDAQDAKQNTRSFNIELRDYLIDTSSKYVQQKQNNDDQQDQADSTATVIANAWAHAITAKSEDQEQNNKNNQQHVHSLSNLCDSAPPNS